jgi:hypothetical protein
MRKATFAVTVAVGAFAVGAHEASAQPEPGHRSCAAFGANVASLANTLGPAFGEAASTVASSSPRAFPTIVVGPEQEAFCEPRL